MRPARRHRHALLVGLVVVLAACTGGGQADVEQPTRAEDGTAEQAEPEKSALDSDPGVAADDPASEPAPGSEEADEGEERGAAETETTDETPEPAGGLAGAVVALDPGHNGANDEHRERINEPVDGGGFDKQCNTVGASTADGYTEAEFNLDLSLVLADELEARGAEVALTRNDNDGVGPCIDERGRFAGTVGADVLVSIHADGAPSEVHGFHVIHPESVEGYTEHIVDDSMRLAVALRDELTDGGLAPATHVGEAGLVRRDDLGTLNHSDVPAVLVEVGNMRNPEDADALRSQPGRAKLAALLAQGLVAYFDEADLQSS